MAQRKTARRVGMHGQSGGRARRAEYRHAAVAACAPIAILTAALLSSIGVFGALHLTHTTFNIASFMGLIMVVGIVAKNGILLLDAEERYHEQHTSAIQAMIWAGGRRLRPILMTALATVAGMIPLALGIGSGAQMLRPLAIAVIGGILASLLFSLIVTPAVHFFIAGRSRVVAAPIVPAPAPSNG